MKVDHAAVSKTMGAELQNMGDYGTPQLPIPLAVFLILPRLYPTSYYPFTKPFSISIVLDMPCDS